MIKLRCKDTNFLQYGENKFRRVGKCSYLCSRFQKEIVKRYTRSVQRNLRNSIVIQNQCNGYRVLRGLIASSYHKVILRTSLQEAAYGATLLLLLMLDAARESGIKKT